MQKSILKAHKGCKISFFNISLPMSNAISLCNNLQSYIYSFFLFTEYGFEEHAADALP